jgi:iron complex transport system ATP-binding protein
LTPVLEARELEFCYPGAAHQVNPRALRGVSLAVQPKSLTAIVGANGSGKSTLIRLLAGLLDPQSGSVLLDGQPLKARDSRMRAREISYVPQRTTLEFPFPAIDVVLSGRSPHVGRFHFEGAADHAKAMEALTTVDAAHLANRSMTALSGGERQMVILARALAQEPRILLLDEPSASLDLKHRAALIRTLTRLRGERGLSVVMVTHDLQFTSAFDRILALRCGETAAEGTPDEVLKSQTLADIYGEPGVRAQRVDGQILVWTEL